MGGNRFSLSTRSALCGRLIYLSVPKVASLAAIALLPEVLPSSPPVFQTPKDISLDQILNYTMCSTTYLHFIYILFYFQESGVYRGVLLSWTKYFLFVDMQLILLRNNFMDCRLVNRVQEICLKK